jgi:hypothetical protein
MRARRTCRSDLSTRAPQNIHSPQQLFFNEKEDKLLFLFAPTSHQLVYYRYDISSSSFQKAFL